MCVSPPDLPVLNPVTGVQDQGDCDGAVVAGALGGARRSVVCHGAARADAPAAAGRHEPSGMEGPCYATPVYRFRTCDYISCCVRLVRYVIRVSSAIPSYKSDTHLMPIMFDDEMVS